MTQITISVSDDELAKLRGQQATETLQRAFSDPIAAAIAVRRVDPYDAFGCGPLFDSVRHAFGTIHRMAPARIANGIAATNDHVHAAFREGVIEARHGRRYTWDEAVFDVSIYSDETPAYINEVLERATEAASHLTIGAHVVVCGNAAGQIDGAPQTVDARLWLLHEGDWFGETAWSILGGTSGSAVKTYPPGWEDFSAAGRFEAAMHPESELVGVAHSSANHRRANGVLQGAVVFQPITSEIRVR